MAKNAQALFKTAAAAGILSAAAALFLWFSLFNIAFLPFLFGIAVNIPVLFVLFAYGARCGIAAAVLASALLCFALPIKPALLLALFFYVPALSVGWLLGLRSGVHSRPAAEPHRGSGQKTAGKAAAEKAASAKPAASQVYPLSAALFQLALIVAFVTIAVLFCTFSGADSAQVFSAAAKQIRQFIEQQNLYDFPMQNTDIDTVLRRFLPVLYAMSLALYGFLFQLAALYAAMRLARQKHLLKRPFGHWPADLRMPPLALLLFITLWPLSYFADSLRFSAAPTLSLCLNVILAVLAVGFCVSGLAILHQVTRGVWLWLRITIYICLFSVVLTPIIFFGLVIMGLFATPFPPRK